MLSKTANHVCGEERGDCVCMVLAMHGMPVRTMLRIMASHTPRVNGMKGCLILVSRLLSTWVRVRVRVRVGGRIRVRARVGVGVRVRRPKVAPSDDHIEQGLEA